MTPGVLVLKLSDGEMKASLSPSGWRSDNRELQQYLNATHPPPSSPYGPFWPDAFDAAVADLRATVVKRPEMDPPVPNRVY